MFILKVKNMFCRNNEVWVTRGVRMAADRGNRCLAVGEKRGKNQKEAGVLFIEAALLLPAMILFLFGLVAAGQMMLANYQISQAATLIGRAVLDEPKMVDAKMVSVVQQAVLSSTAMGGDARVGARSFGGTAPTLTQVKQLHLDSAKTTVPKLSDNLRFLEEVNCTTYPCWVAVTYRRTLLPNTMFGKIFPITLGGHSVVRIASSGYKSVVKYKEFQYRMKVNEWDDKDAGNPNFSKGFTPELTSGDGKKVIQGTSGTEVYGLDPEDTDSAIIQLNPYTSTTYIDQKWGLRCNSSNGWIGVGCGMTTNGELYSSTKKSSFLDSDTLLNSNGCYTDQEELGAEAKLWIRCMKTSVQP